MTERLLQFIWQFQYFNNKHLQLPGGESFDIVHPGLLNANQGPDFLAARIKMGDALIIGPVELHIKTSGWYKHAHQFDHHYDKVILHVVWEDDMDSSQSPIPVLSLRDRVSKLLLQQYEDWMNNRWFIACEQQITQVSDITWLSWNERLLVERLQRKSAIVCELLQQNNQHWEETFWWLLARNFGIKVNAEAFEAVARSIPLTVLGKHKNRLLQLEALLLGQAGLLEKDYEDGYARQLKEAYQFYQAKYKLQKGPNTTLFLRMRPASFPTIRLAQLAMLIHSSGHLFSKIKEIISVKDVKSLLDVTASAYWDQHYTFDKISPAKPKKQGDSMINNIIINTVVPVLFAYGYLRQEQEYKDRALKWMEETAAEKNTIIQGFAQCGIKSRNAFESQALLELKNRYCDPKRCLDCAVGNGLLKGSSKQ
ncbi:DUF2851 family protein [Paraflavitalea soli]|uniref:DUF2851 family protein n=1 Tax=Paraflavitalea soli TaxID=2315862 RepID=A0A3B7MN75_9BACT|nr:DUF2851 family protein [Paraflavitalea soli]AXY74480.1 DUF2851 family protein [Paraflavitalea soli]